MSVVLPPDEIAGRLPSPFVGGRPETRARLVPAAHGRIEDVLLAVPPYRNATDDEPVFPMYERHLRSLIHLLGPNRRYTIVCHRSQRARVGEWLDEIEVPAEHRTIVLSIFGYSLWAQDACVVLQSDADELGRLPRPSTWLCKGTYFPRFEDASIFADIAVQSSHGLVQSILYFQGGNILGTPGLAIVGKDSVWKNQARVFLENEGRVLDQFEKLVGSHVVAIGTDKLIEREGFPGCSGWFQPIVHLDMYIMPTGVVGESGREIVMVGRPARARELLGETAGPYDHDLYFEGAAQALSAHFEVRDLPLLPVFGNLGHSEVAPRHYHLSWTNALVESWTEADGAARRSVILPAYSSDAEMYGVPRDVRERLDEAAAATWAELGFAVLRSDGVEDLAFHVGGVHCIAKDLRRGAWRVTNSGD